MQNLEFLVHSLAREYGSECVETWNRVFSEMYPELASNWTHNTGNGSKANNTYTMGPIPDFFWTAIFSIMLVVAIFGNLIVFWIVLGKATDVAFSPCCSSFSKTLKRIATFAWQLFFKRLMNFCHAVKVSSLSAFLKERQLPFQVTVECRM